MRLIKELNEYAKGLTSLAHDKCHVIVIISIKDIPCMAQLQRSLVVDSDSEKEYL
jgi:hypothetical protein